MENKKRFVSLRRVLERFGVFEETVEKTLGKKTLGSYSINQDVDYYNAQKTAEEIESMSEAYMSQGTGKTHELIGELGKKVESVIAALKQKDREKVVSAFNSCKHVVWNVYGEIESMSSRDSMTRDSLGSRSASKSLSRVLDAITVAESEYADCEDVIMKCEKARERALREYSTLIDGASRDEEIAAIDALESMVGED